MYLAQGIKKRWEEEKQKDTEYSKVASLSYLLEYEYKQYINLCYWTYQTPLEYGKWLTQKIN